MSLQESLKRGDGLVFDAGAPDSDEEGGNIYSMQASKRPSSGSSACVDLTFGIGQLNLKRIKVPDQEATLWTCLLLTCQHQVVVC